MKRSKAFYIYLILTLLWMGVIFWFSSHTADVSKAESGRVLAFIKQIYLSFTGTYLNEAVINLLHTLVRKAGHLFNYAVLGIFTASTIREYFRQPGKYKPVPSGIRHLLLAFMICVFYAATDEIHQLFVPGRGGMASDVLLDGIGALIGICSVGNATRLRDRYY